MRFLALVLLAGCDLGMTAEVTPWRAEVWSTSPRVEAFLRDRHGVPDDQTDYRIRAHGKTILEGNLEHFNRRHAIRPLASGGVEIAIWDRACIVTATTADCRAIDYARW